MNNLTEQLERLARLKAEGALSESEFTQAKAQLLRAEGRDGGFSGALSRLTRARYDRWLGGVANGLATATDLPVWAWRVLFVLLALLHGVGVVLYLLMWLFVPLQSDTAQAAAAPAPPPQTPES
jgi:phage shock protein PspC (stress-responsive transcriptional regulator)